jgi:hypothetical protein
VTAKVDGLPLAPFNPYAAGTGYGVGGGAASLESKFSMKGDAYTRPATSCCRGWR